MAKGNKSAFLSVVIPAYNEELNFLAGVLNELMEFLRSQKYIWELVFVDDGSTDKTKKMLTKFCKENKQCRLMAIPHGGRAAAMRVGMIAALGKFVLYTDFDQSTSMRNLQNFLPKIRHFDLVIGTRGGNGTTRYDSRLNKLRAKAFLLIANHLMVAKITDINCGFKLYKRNAAQKIFSSLIVSRPRKISHAYMGAIDTEILFLARKFKFKIAQVPVNWERRPYVSHLDLWREPLMIILDLLSMKWHNFLGHYD